MRHCDEVYPIYMQIMYIYILSILIALGTLGNLISLKDFLVQIRRKGRRSLVLLIALAVADSLYLFSSIFSRILPTISKYVFIGEHLSWSIYIRPYATVIASMFQIFASYMVLSVTLQRYIHCVANCGCQQEEMYFLYLDHFCYHHFSTKVAHLNI